MNKLLAIDLDGTLLRSDKTLSEASKSEIKRIYDKGVTIVAASGRGFHTLPDNVVCTTQVTHAITLNGAATYQMHPKIALHESRLLPETIEQILDLTIRERGICYEAFMEGYGYANMEYVQEPNRYGASRLSLEYIRQTREPVENMPAFLKKFKHRFNSMDLIVPDLEQKARILHKLRTQVPAIYVTTSSRNLIEISHFGSGKEQALQMLADRLGIKREEIVAIGDADNDAGMLRWAGTGIAMENATEYCRSCADYVTRSNDDEGVARALKKFF